MQRVKDNDGDVWTKGEDELWRFGSCEPRSLDRIEEEYGPYIWVEGSPDNLSDVFIVASKDWDYNTTILLTTSVEMIATELVSALKLADTGGYYTYSVERKAVVR